MMKTGVSVEALYSGQAWLYERFFVDFLGWGRALETFFKASNHLRPQAQVLDAGCGTGIITRTLYRIAREQGIDGIKFHAFDLAAGMLEIFQGWVAREGAENIELREADVLEPAGFPPHWHGYDLIVLSTMLEYLPGASAKDALAHLKDMLAMHGILLVIVTKRNPATEWLARGWWQARPYDGIELRELFQGAGFKRIESRVFSPRWSSFIMVMQAGN